MSLPSLNAFIDYKIFVGLAVSGLQRDADQQMRRARDNINSVASYLRSLLPPPIKTLYRGLLLEPEVAATGRIGGHYQGAEYTSFTEDEDVACYFASPKTNISGSWMQQKPRSTGWIAEYIPNLSDIIFHHSWTEYLNNSTPSIYELMLQIAGQSDRGKDLVTQLRWHLKNQQEVICKTGIPLDIKPVDDYSCPDAQTLDNRFTPRSDFVIAPPGLEGLGITAGERLYIKSAEFPHDYLPCPTCRSPGINAIYHLDRANLQLYRCANCGQNMFARQNPDEEIQRLARAASQGGFEDFQRLIIARHRAGLPIKEMLEEEWAFLCSVCSTVHRRRHEDYCEECDSEICPNCSWGICEYCGYNLCYKCSGTHACEALIKEAEDEYYTESQPYHPEDEYDDWDDDVFW